MTAKPIDSIQGQPVYHIPDPDWRFDPDGNKRGYIQPGSLQELWFHTGSVCNLSCDFCLEGSRPGDNRINALTLEDVKPFINEALTLGVEKFSFTGGEPFVIPEMVQILQLALNHRPCQVLTNATEPILNRIHEVIALKNKPNALSFRVSLDSSEPEKHDKFRGKGNFNLALKVLGKLHQEGFKVSIARLLEKGEDAATSNAAYTRHFVKAGLPENTNIVVFPDFHVPGSNPEVPFITESCMVKFLSPETRDKIMCNFSKMIVKKNGKTGVYACTLVDDDKDYDLAPTLSEAMQYRVMLKHHRCYSCFANGASCSET